MDVFIVTQCIWLSFSNFWYKELPFNLYLPILTFALSEVFRPDCTLIGHSLNTAFTNCESVKCINLRFIHTLFIGVNSKLECDVIVK